MTNAISRSIAVVSGKGGSGKTMVTATMAAILSEHTPVTVIDADTGTGGMTYYLGLKKVPNIRVGFTDVARKGLSADLIDAVLQPIAGLQNARILGLGNHRKLHKEISEEEIPRILASVLDYVKTLPGVSIVDCRGGIDRDSIAVCSVVDDIILVVEPDTTSFQATQHVVDILSDYDLAHKLRGFIINKVFDNPSVVARSGTSVFGTQYLASIPFDLSATRSFLVGEIPKARSLFGIHVSEAVHKAYPEIVPNMTGRPWTFQEFREVGLTNLDSLRGGTAIAGLIMATLMMVYLPRFLGSPLPLNPESVYFAIAFLGLCGSMEPTRRLLGKAIEAYVRVGKRLFGQDDQS